LGEKEFGKTFGVRGSEAEKLRKKSAEVIGGMDFDGFGIGGSFAKEDMSTAVKWVNEILPEEKPRHLLGIGEPEDLFMGVENGVDLFDCVGPTRIARNGTLFTKNGKINITNAKFVNDFNPIDEGCNCYTCSNYTKSYLAHLFRAKEMLGATLASIHNVYFINKLVSDMRQAILEDKFFEFKKEFLAGYLK
jgi:queuine tRNA-ribosyltransferase